MIELRFTPTGVGTIKAIASLASNSSVHPHGRGDNKMRIRQIGTLVGSPPRAWGQSDRGGAVGVGERFTPTGVGTIRNQRWCSTPETVHPHGRGDNLTLNCEKDFDIGSPPRAWGQLCSSSSRHNSSRFTPTGVGTIARCHAAQPVTAVHPHGRGDNRGEGGVGHSLAGSPPRAWGQSCRRLPSVGRVRFTPTGVGTIRGRLRLRPTRSVHPHGRGDNGDERRRG